MGQAKQRGTYEERKAQGIAKRNILLDERSNAMTVFYAAMTPAQRQAHNRRLRIAALMRLHIRSMP